jgi:hypothetical protein
VSEPTKAELKVLLYVAEGQKKIALYERDEARAAQAAAEQQAEAYKSELLNLRRGCMVSAGTACRLCFGSWPSYRRERASDHHFWCPMRATVELAASPPAAPAVEPADGTQATR